MVYYPIRFKGCKLNVIHQAKAKKYKWWLLNRGSKTPCIVYENLDQVYDDIIFRLRTGQFPNCTIYIHSVNGLVENVLANVSIKSGE